MRVLKGSSIEGYRERIVAGPILSSMVRLGLPLMLTDVIFLFYNLTDAFWLSRFSPYALAVPRCSSKLADNGYRALRCSKCSFIGDRDVVAVVNLYKKYTSHSRCGEPGVSPNVPKSDEAPSGVQGNRGEAMNHTNTHKPT